MWLVAAAPIQQVESQEAELQGALTPQQKRRRGISTPVRLTKMIHAEKSPALSVSL